MHFLHPRIFCMHFLHPCISYICAFIASLHFLHPCISCILAFPTSVLFLHPCISCILAFLASLHFLHPHISYILAFFASLHFLHPCISCIHAFSACFYKVPSSLHFIYAFVHTGTFLIQAMCGHESVSIRGSRFVYGIKNCDGCIWRCWDLFTSIFLHSLLFLTNFRFKVSKYTQTILPRSQPFLLEVEVKMGITLFLFYTYFFKNVNLPDRKSAHQTNTMKIFLYLHCFTYLHIYI